jgi:cystinosin
MSTKNHSFSLQQIPPSQHFNRNHFTTPTDLYDDDTEDDNKSRKSEDDSVELMPTTTKSSAHVENEEFVKDDEPTSTTTMILPPPLSKTEHEPENPNDDEIRDQVEDISAVIPPDTFSLFTGCEIKVNTIWILTLVLSTLCGIIVGLLFAPPCEEYYSKDLLLLTDDNRGLRDIFPTSAQPTFQNHHQYENPSSPSPSKCGWALFSSCIGNIYSLQWTLSFLPSIFVNYQRKSVVGQSIAFVYTNALGFTCLAVFNSFLFFSTDLKKLYQARFKSKNNVDFNDVYYAAFACLCCYINAYQCLVYERGGQTIHKGWKIFIWGSVTVAVLWLVLIGLFYHRDDERNNILLVNPLDFLYGLGLIKVLVTLFKYVPQVYLNYQRKKTVGLAMSNFLLDFSGGTLSLCQSLLDAGLKDAWIALAGNYVKLCLSVISISYDTIFMVQHYCIYAQNNKQLMEEYQRKKRILRVRELVGNNIIND